MVVVVESNSSSIGFFKKCLNPVLDANCGVAMMEGCVVAHPKSVNWVVMAN